MKSYKQHVIYTMLYLSSFFPYEVKMYIWSFYVLYATIIIFSLLHTY